MKRYFGGYIIFGPNLVNKMTPFIVLICNSNQPNSFSYMKLDQTVNIEWLHPIGLVVDKMHTIFCLDVAMLALYSTVGMLYSLCTEGV